MSVKSLLISEPHVPPQQTRRYNSLNGSDAESYAMAKMVLACRGEGHWGSREEDYAKIDLAFSYNHPWHSKERLLVLAQAKSGPSYGEIINTGFKLTKSAKAAAIRTSHDICIVWVDRDKNRIFWAYIHPDSTNREQEYGRYHELSPCTLYDLARCVAFRGAGARGGKGLVIRRRTNAVTQRRKEVHEVYRKASSIISPVLGKIELTRNGWRHMFRSGRSRQNKSKSLDLIPYLGKLVRQLPSSHSITDNKSFKSAGYAFRICEHLLKYDQVKVYEEVIDSSKNTSTSFTSLATAHVRVVEEIRYPLDWESNVMLSQMILRRVVLKSAYYKLNE